ncbi:hypothetical protein BRD00_15495 [Halobacteriales archaeon QS_8_69_26]|nr:MAG: hypothetical protein BRD00_15495 [Halobacteriales archaeon QS_8_69_26]
MYLVLTVMFFLVAFFPDLPGSMGEAMMDSGPPDGSPRDSDTPLTERYVTWLVKYTTLDWSYGSGGPMAGESTTTKVWNALKLTLTYLLPALGVAYVVGLLVGLHAALRHDTLADRAGRLLAYVGFAIPSFFLAIMVLYTLLSQIGWLYPYFDPERDVWSAYNIQRLVAPSAVVAVGMVAVQIRHVRSESVKYVNEDFVKLVRAQGASTWSVGRHIARNAATNLVSLFVSDLLGVVLLSVIAVEVVFDLPGFGNLLLEAASDRDPELVMGVTVVTVAVGIGGNLLQDVVARSFDPRIGSEGE